MASPDLVKYIGEARARGMSDDAIRTVLLNTGWEKPDIEAALGPRPPEKEAAPPPPSFAPQARPATPSSGGGRMVFEGSVSVAGAGYSLPPARKLIGRTFSFYFSHFGIFAAIASFPIIFALLQMMLSRWGGASLTATALSLTATALSLVFYVLVIFIGYLAFLAFLGAVTEDGAPQGGVWGAYHRGLRMLFSAAWVGFLVSLTTLGGAVLLIVPGIVITLLLSISFYALFAEDRRGISALAASWHYIRGYWLAVFWRFIVYGVLMLVVNLAVATVAFGPTIFSILISGALQPQSYLLGIGSIIFSVFTYLFLYPLGIIYSYFIYISLKEVKASAPFEESAAKLKRRVKIFMGIGIVGLVVLVAGAGYLYFVYAPSQSLINERNERYGQDLLGAGKLVVQARDSQRVLDLNTLKSAISLYLADVGPPLKCQTGEIYSSKYGSIAVDGSGWFPVDFTAIRYGAPFYTLKTDPINNGEYFYSYACNTTRSTFELNAVLESGKESSANDGGNNPSVYEVGTSLDIIP